jgi:hypothetical protein
VTVDRSPGEGVIETGGWERSLIRKAWGGGLGSAFLRTQTWAPTS